MHVFFYVCSAFTIISYATLAQEEQKQEIRDMDYNNGNENMKDYPSANFESNSLEQSVDSEHQSVSSTPPNQQGSESAYTQSDLHADEPVYVPYGQQNSEPMPVSANLRSDGPSYFINAHQAAHSEIPNEDAKFSEVRSGVASAMYTPGIGATDGFQQQVRISDTVQLKKANTRRSGRFLRAVCLIIVCVMLSGVAAYGVTEYRLKNIEISPVNQVILGSNSSDTRQDLNINTPLATVGREMDAQDIYDMACSQVVGITTEIEGFGGFFGQQGSMTAVSGSGFIISSDGYILTNYHVIETAYLQDLPIMVHTNDESVFEAKLIGYESSNDIALIKIDATRLKAAAIANSDNIRVGERVYAVGNPFGELVYTMTEGIVSALDRVVTVENKSINTFQLSAAVNPGNSGCPVYDTNGEVIGIVSAKFMSSTVEGIGFAIPINDAIAIATDLIEHGYIPGRAFMGIEVKTVTRGSSEYFGWEVLGAYVTSVTSGSAADRAGILVNDIITKLGDDEIDSRDTLVIMLRKFSAGDTTTLIVRRSGEDVELTITFDENMAAGKPQLQESPQQQLVPEVSG